MRWTRLEMMREHVRAIHRAVVGTDPPEAGPPDENALPPSPEVVAQRFGELEALARSNAVIAERVPPFSFLPPLDVIGTDREIILELGVPGVERSDVEVELADGTVIISGALSTTPMPDGRAYLHAEMPRGPFRRIVQLPEPTIGPPRVEVLNGVVRTRLAKTSKSPLPRA